MECTDWKSKRRRKSSKDKNTKRVLQKERQGSELETKNLALKSAFKLLNYAARIKMKSRRNKKCIEQELARDPNFVRSKGLIEIVSKINKEYGTV